MIADLETQGTRDELVSVVEPKDMREKALFAYLYGDDSYVQLGSDNAPVASGKQNPYTHMQRRILDPLKDALRKAANDTATRGVKEEAAAAPNYDAMFGAIGSGGGLAPAPSTATPAQNFGSLVEEARRARKAALEGRP